MKMKGKVVILVIAIMVLLVPVNAFAGSRPYKDVTVKKVGKDGYNSICFVKKHWGYIDLVNTNAKFKPNKKITRREFCVILGNFYGDNNVPVNMREDVRKGNKVATEKWACKKMTQVAKKLGVDLDWSPNSNGKLTRVWASQYIKVFATYDPAFAPRQ